MHEEPFGPLAVISPFSAFDEVVTEANRLPYGLASYAYTRSAKTANAIAAAVESGMIVDQPPRPRAAGSAVRRREGFRLRLGRRTRRRSRAISTPSSSPRRACSFQRWWRRSVERGAQFPFRCTVIPWRCRVARHWVCCLGRSPLLRCRRRWWRGRRPGAGRAGAAHQDLGIQHQPALLHHRHVPCHRRVAAGPEEAGRRGAGQHRPRAARCRRQPRRTPR